MSYWIELSPDALETRNDKSGYRPALPESGHLYLHVTDDGHFIEAYPKDLEEDIGVGECINLASEAHIRAQGDTSHDGLIGEPMLPDAKPVSEPVRS